jgi:hypothetical protein
MVSDQIRGWLNMVPDGILRLAARRLDADIRHETYEEVWLPDLAHALRGAEAVPVTRLFRGIKFAVELFYAAPRINREAKAPSLQQTARGGLVVPVGGRRDVELRRAEWVEPVQNDDGRIVNVAELRADGWWIVPVDGRVLFFPPVHYQGPYRQIC